VSFLLLALLLGALSLHLQASPLQASLLQAGAGSGGPQLLENGAYGWTLIDRIHHAKRRIICAFYLFRITDSPRNLPRAVAGELIAAQRRGVDVTVILDGGKPIEKKDRTATRLLAQGGVRVVFATAGVTTHAKAVSIDDRYVLIGSHNLTQSALTRNNELSLVVDSPQLAMQVRWYLEQLK